MTTLLKITTLLFLASCSADTDTGETIIQSKEIERDTTQKSTNDLPVHYFDTTMVINKQSFLIKTEDINQENVLLTVNSELIDTLDSGGLLGLEFIDLNKDNNEDILISYIGNNPTNDLYLFDPESNKFRSLDGFINYPEAIQLKSNPEYYYSYHRAGCADLDWVSDLFTIENFKTIQLGHIYGKSCEDEPQVIEIYRISDNKEENKELIEKLPYSENIQKYNDKWDFIEKYWNKNATKFKKNAR